MKQTLLVLLLGWACIGYGQKMTLIGDPTDSTILARKKRLEAKGFEVVIQQADRTENPLLTMGNQAFRHQYLKQTLPAFTLKDICGKTITSADLRGKYVHINFWSTTCAPCIVEFPELNELKKKYGEKGWVFLAFAPESGKQVKQIIGKRPLDYTIIPDAKAYYKQVGIDGYPKNFFVDKTGMIVQVTDGTKFVKNPQTGEMKPDNYRFYDQIMAAIK